MDRLASLYTPDGMVLPPDAPMELEVAGDGRWALHRDIWNGKG